MDKSYAVQHVPSPMSLASQISNTTVTDKPTSEQLQMWWQTMQSDDLSVAYADSFPQALTDFRLEVTQGEKLLLLCMINGQVGGAFWLHDLQHDDDGTVVGGWLGAYFLPAYRGRLIVQWWTKARRHWEAGGVKHFFSAIHVDNRCSQAMLTRGLRFHLVERFPRFSQYQGQLTDLFIYTLHAEDAMLAWKFANVRATQQVAGMV